MMFSSFRYQMQKNCKLSFAFLFTYFKMQGFLTDITLLIVSLFEKQTDYSVVPYYVSPIMFNKIDLKKLLTLAFHRFLKNNLRWQNICEKANSSVQIFLRHNLSLYTPLLRSEGPPLTQNFQQIHPVIKYDNWCPSYLLFKSLKI